MVSYYNHMAMYRQQTAVMPPQTHFNNTGSAPAGWYSPYANNSGGHQHHHQQLLNCMQDGGGEGTGTGQVAWHHHGVFHQHHAGDYLEQKYIVPHQLPGGGCSGSGIGYEGGGPHEPPPQLPSPPMSVSELSSPGNLTPPQHQTRPPPIRSPYDWINKPNYQTQPNPGKSLFSLNHLIRCQIETN